MVIAWFLSFWSSVCLIEAATFFSGVEDFGLTFDVGSITNQPYCALCTGAWTTFVLPLKSALSNSATVCPCVNVALPQVALELGSCEYFFASVHHVAALPAFSCA